MEKTWIKPAYLALLNELRRNGKAVSPAISTVVITGSIIVLLLVTVAFEGNLLNARVAEYEFSAMKQFMQTIGLQVDDVAWTVGRTQTISYASRFGNVNFEPLAVNYTIYVNENVYFVSYAVGIVLFDMPVSMYSLGNNYYENIFPSSSSFLQIGASAPVCMIYAVEKMPMYDGGFIRVVDVPIIRMLNSTIFSGGETLNYFKFYLPVLTSGIHPRHSQSVTLIGQNVSVSTQGDVNTIRISVSFPKASLGFDAMFFNFEAQTVEVNVPSGSIVEFYAGEVAVSLGLY